MKMYTRSDYVKLTKNQVIKRVQNNKNNIAFYIDFDGDMYGFVLHKHDGRGGHFPHENVSFTIDGRLWNTYRKIQKMGKLITLLQFHDIFPLHCPRKLLEAETIADELGI